MTVSVGTGESGKSTIAKQMRILHLKGFTQEDRLSYKSIVQKNAIFAMKAVVDAAAELEIQVENKVR